MINRAISRSEPILHISEQFVGFKIPDKSMVDHSFKANCQGNRTIIGWICWIFIRAFPQSEGKSPEIQFVGVGLLFFVLFFRY